MSDNLYIRSDDSRLLEESIANQEPADSFLEIGVGNGGNLKIASNLFSLVVGTDIVNVSEVKKEFPFVEIVISDRATPFRNNVFDLVAFNPPYVPSKDVVDKSVDAGPSGFEVPLLFLESARQVVKKDGKILMLTSNLGKASMLVEYCSLHALTLKMIAEKKLFFETLYVYEITSKKR